MTVNAPEIDLRRQPEISARLRELLRHHCPDRWENTEAIREDKWTDSLVQVYARMMETVIRRINRVPDKNFIAFLDTLGISPLPPRPARTALVFELAKGSPPHARVLSGAQVAASESPDGKPVVFETEGDLAVIAPKLIKAISISPDDDKYSDHSDVLLNDEKEGKETLFKGNELVPHRLYIAGGDDFSFEEASRITIKVELENIPDRSVPWEVRWYTCSADSDAPVELETEISCKIDALDLLRTGDIIFPNVISVPEKTLTGFSGETAPSFQLTDRWIYAELKRPIPNSGLPKIKSFKVKVEKIQASGEDILPEIAFFGHFPLDVTKDFLPFGTRPKLSDVFYIGSKEVLGKTDSYISIEIDLSAGTKPATKKITLIWEFWDGKRWSVIEETNHRGVNEKKGDFDFKDTTNAFKQAGRISFTCPPVKPGKVNGKENHWVRVRISRGDYGKEAYAEQVKDAKVLGGFKWIYHEATYAPPSIEKMELNCEPQLKAPKGVVLKNSFYYEAQFYGESGPTCPPFYPFRKTEENDAALYLAFDGDLSTLPLRLFFPLLTDVSAASASNRDALPPDLRWEYWDGTDWKTLMVEDETKELTRRGMINLLIPEDFKRRPSFGEDLHWIRARLAGGKYGGGPLIAGIYRNAVWAENRVTMKDLLLGSGIGIPYQHFTLPGHPVLAGQEVVVRELELAEEDKKVMEGDKGEAVYEEAERSGKASERWVRWHEADHFKFSGPHSRHYLVDREKGIITFGDGKKGMIPQAGRNNIVCRLYGYGGGLRGNVKKGQVTKLRKAIPYIDSVCNPVDAEGGVNVEGFEKVKVRGPRTIRHRNKAVTVRDYEWIVKEASPKVARVKGLAVTNPDKLFTPGWVTVMIVPESEEVKPLPSAELIGEVKNYLSKRSPSSLTKLVEEEQINIIPPNYLKVKARVKVMVRSISDAKEVEYLVTRRLLDFFHPLKGGPEGEGWEFGRDVYKTEIYEAIEKIEKVDYVEAVALEATEQIFTINVDEANSLYLPAPFPEHSRTHFEDGKIIFSLAEEIPGKKELRRFSVTGFMEGDHLSLTHEDNDGKVQATIDLYVTAVDGGRLTCLPQKTEHYFPAQGTQKTMVETSLKDEDLNIRSYLVKEIKENSEIREIEVALPLSGKSFEIVHRDWRSNTISGLAADVTDEIETVYLEEDYLVYSGEHKVTIISPDTTGEEDSTAGDSGTGDESGGEDEIVKDYPYLLNIRTGEVHSRNSERPGCMISKMKSEHRKDLESLDKIRYLLDEEIFDYCYWCFGPEASKR